MKSCSKLQKLPLKTKVAHKMKSNLWKPLFQSHDSIVYTLLAIFGKSKDPVI
jgi:hypothetical protein